MAQRRTVAMGDPQAPFLTVLAVLRAHALLTDTGRLRDEVHLVSMGDHFDWGLREQRADATADGLRLVEWLASHGPEQVTLLLGNHDLARVQELAPFDAASFREAQQLADAAYDQGRIDPVLNAELIRAFPSVPDAECLARDYACFVVEQRELVTELLRSGRFTLALASGTTLLNHAGITVADLATLGAEPTAKSISHALNNFLRSRVAAWTSGPLDLTPLYRSGNAAEGEGVGITCHRPIDPSLLTLPVGPPPRRRYDPRTLPTGVTQVIGHIRDEKCRTLMPRWSSDAPTPRGALRSLVITADTVSYGPGITTDACLICIDGGMAHTEPNAYELLDVDRLQPVSKRASSGV